MNESGKKALIIGIDEYISDDLEQLSSCKRDAEQLSNLISTKSFGYTIFRGGPLIGSKLDKEYGWANIRTIINNFFTSAKPSDTLLFYFSGHGIPYGDDVYLCTPTVDPKNPFDKGFALSDLTKLMGLCKSKRLVGIIDACYSGAADLPFGRKKKAAAQGEAKIALANYDKIWKKTPRTKGIYLLLSSQSYETSNAETNGNSLYTKYVIEGLRGVRPSIEDEKQIQGSVDDSGNVTPDTLHEFVYNKVAGITDQVPDMKVDRASGIILAHYPLYSKKKHDLLKILQDSRVRDFNKITESHIKDGIIKHGTDIDERKFTYRLDFNGVIIKGANLTGVKLHEADLCRTRLSKTNFTKAKLYWSNLANANLDGAILNRANLQNAYLYEVRLTKAKLIRANLSNAILTRPNLNAAILQYTNLSRSILVGCLDYKGLVCNNANFDGAVIDNKEFVNYLTQGNAKNVPCAVTTKKELALKIKEKKYEDKELFEKILESSYVTE